jgi:hypothetical protein
MPQAQPRSSEAAIVGRLMEPDRADLSPEATRDLLNVQFGEEDKARMRELSLKAHEGTLIAPDQDEMEKYRRVR